MTSVKGNGNSEATGPERICSEEPAQEEIELPWHLGIYDAHCHPTETMQSFDMIKGMKTRALTIMATRKTDQELVLDFIEQSRQEQSQLRVIPAFGWHPWFSHGIIDDLNPGLNVESTVSQRAENSIGDSQYFPESANPTKEDHYKNVLIPAPAAEDMYLIESLEEPQSLTKLLVEMEQHLASHPDALVGEIGLDRSFRVPLPKCTNPKHCPGRDESHNQETSRPSPVKRLSRFRVDLAHQRKILLAQLSLAGKMQRAVSVHGVAAHGVLYETLQQIWSGHELRPQSKRQRKRQNDDHSSSRSSSGIQELSTTSTSSPPEPILSSRLEPDTPGSRSSVMHSSSISTDETISQPFPLRICLHSYSGSVEALRRYLDPSVPSTIFFSFSVLVNFSNLHKSRPPELSKDPASHQNDNGDRVPAEKSETAMDLNSSSPYAKVLAVIKSVPDDRILAESDFHTAGQEMDNLMEDVIRKICHCKGWSLHQGVRQLARNWRHFACGVDEPIE